MHAMNHKRAAKRVKPGTGRTLDRFRWWQNLSRSLFAISIGQQPLHQYQIDVRHRRRFFAEDGKGTADLYVDGIHTASSKMPAAFAVAGGVIEVQDSTFGLRRCHFVARDGAQRALVPDQKSAEGRRARLAIEHPLASVGIATSSVLLLVVGLGLNLLQLAEPLSEIPPIHDVFGPFESPLHLPIWLNLLLGAGATLGSMERALRLRHSWLDLGGN